MGAQRAEKLKQALKASKKTAAEARASFLRAEDVLASLEDREGRREARERAVRERR
jgi:hypothetical protein